jgi:hypothetical protein
MPDVRFLLGNGPSQAEKPPRPFREIVEMDVHTFVSGDRHDFIEES